MNSVDEWILKANARHDGDGRCERHDRSTLCHCHKRAREARGVTTLPTEDLYFPPPDCPSCDAGLCHDGDGWVCGPCGLSWDSSGDGSTAQWTDVYGNEARCSEHGRTFCWHCEQASR